MKTITQLSILIACAMFTVGGCATVKEQAIPANVRVAATILTSNALLFAVTPQDRVEVANYLYSGAHGIRTLSGGKVPTVGEFEAAFKLFTKSGSKYVNLAQSLSQLWGGLYLNVKGNPKLTLEYLEALAGGVEDAASGFLPGATPAR